MDFHCIEALLGLPEFRVIAQVCGPQQLDLHLQRRDEHIVCPRCQACCSRVKESRPRCIRDLPILEHPVMLWLHMRRFQCADCRHRPWETSETVGAQVPGTERLYTPVREECLQRGPCRALPPRYGLAKRTGFRSTVEKNRGGRLTKLRRALDAVLRSGQKQLDQAEAKELKKLRKRWLKSADQLHVDELIARYEWRWRFPEWCEMIDWVQDLRRWFDRKYDKPAREALFKLIERASQSAQESLQRVAGTLSRWFEPIVRYIRHRYTNGMTEGFNNKIKLIQRMAYGLRNEHNRRKRILACCGKT